MHLVHVASYRRLIGASLARVWENVLDWEHLPWLHRTTFRHLELLTDGPTGWRARTAMRESRGRDFVIDVAIDRGARLYHTRTLDGPGAGTDIVTRLDPRGERATAITVEFHLPGIPPARAAEVGARYTQLYARLWDEDETMMQRRQALLDGTLARGRRTAAVGQRSVCFGTVCPHRGGPLDSAPIEDGCVTCPWHGYRFDVGSRQSADGRGLELDP